MFTVESFKAALADLQKQAVLNGHKMHVEFRKDVFLVEMETPTYKMEKSMFRYREHVMEKLYPKLKKRIEN